MKGGLPPLFSAFNNFQVKVLYRRAHDHFDRAEDKEDFIQNAALIAWEDWVSKGRKTFNGESDIYEVNYLAKSALSFTKRSLSMGTGGKYQALTLLKSDGEFLVNSLKDKSWEESTLFCVPKNPKDALSLTRHTLISESGMKLKLSYAELRELFDMTQDSIGRSKRLKRKVKAFLYQGVFYPNLTKVQEKFGITEAKARWHTTKYEFEWEQK